MESLSHERISWVDPQLYHITLRFLGDTEISVIEKIKMALQNRVVLPVKMNEMLSRATSFGSRNRPRVIWVGFENCSLIESLKREVDSALKVCGIPPSNQPFTAHLTLGRVRGLNDLDRFYEVIASMKDQFSYPLLLDKMDFYRSELSKRGPLYTSLHRLEFGD